MIIAIDGPSASGKSTIAKEIAKRLGFNYIDTGAMYRAITWKALSEKIDPTDEEAFVNITKRDKITFSGSGIDQRIFIGDEDVTEKIRLPKVSSFVSVVAKIPGVRKMLVQRQREIVRGKDAVVEGRDIGTVVFPDAMIKIFLTASSLERARRRQIELEEKGHKLELVTVKREIVSRDAIDSKRRVSPLKVASDARITDTTDKSIEEVVEEILNFIRNEELK